MQRLEVNRRLMACLLFIVALAASGCNSARQTESPDNELTPLSIPELQPAELNGDRLRVVATTSMIGDVVSQVGGEAIELTTLMEAGQDPHGFEPAAGGAHSGRRRCPNRRKWPDGRALPGTRQGSGRAGVGSRVRPPAGIPPARNLRP